LPEADGKVRKKYIVTIGQETRAFLKKGTPHRLGVTAYRAGPSLYNARKLANDLCDMYIKHESMK
jgi:hypothetical protein